MDCYDLYNYATQISFLLVLLFITGNKKIHMSYSSITVVFLLKTATVLVSSEMGSVKQPHNPRCKVKDMSKGMSAFDTCSVTIYK